MTLAYSGQHVELREIVLKSKPQELLQISPKATVPVLQCEDGNILEESLDIMFWALQQHDPQNWLQDHDAQTDLITDNDQHFKARLDRYKYADRYPEHTETFYREQCFDFLNKLEERLLTQAYLFGEQIRLADVAIFPFIRQFAHVDLTWFDQSPWPALKHWLNMFKQSSLFTRSMAKYPAWQPGDDALFFPSDTF